ncbi:PIN domain-containing protein [Acidithiobacillus sulfurivorans]|uniref:PIN domain-containing protein n=1 Tax=Acidithiobacillus sulfurivorans TaxID=1958756 RepID=A0ABS5ZVJ7_9PROT|nr:PIN domain-containing protein [Acidithiobacillus sulfurivorans]MBU2759080.1 PIN domain-containing protein [Acidithiobacillus sulfurivorans]
MGRISHPVSIFLDANILFSAALGGEAFALLWDLAKQRKVILHSSSYCLTEARRNIVRKRPAAQSVLENLLTNVRVVPHADQVNFSVDLNAKDLPVLASAVASGVDVLLTGDIRHFGPLMGLPDLPVRVMTIRSFLLVGP